MSKKQKNLAVLASVFLMLLTIAPVSNAMHIMEGFLPVKYCILWGVICVPFLVIGFMNIKKVLGNDRRTLTVLALTGAFVWSWTSRASRCTRAPATASSPARSSRTTALISSMPAESNWLREWHSHQRILH